MNSVLTHYQQFFGERDDSSFLEARRVFNNTGNEVTKKHIPEYGVPQMNPALQEKVLLETQVSKILELKDLKEKTVFKNRLADLKKGISDTEKNTEKLPRSEIIFEIIEKKVQKLSPQKLLMIEDIFPGTLKKLFIKENGVIDFRGNTAAENIIGMGDVMPLSQTYIVIYDERTGEWEAGVRGIKDTSMGPRPAYLNIGSSDSDKKNAKKPPSKPGDYIEILDNYKVVEIEGKSGIDAFKKDIETTDIKNIISKDEAIFDTKIKNTLGKEVNIKEDIQKNNDAKEDWVENVSEIQKGFIKGSSIEATEFLDDTILGDLKYEISRGEGDYNSFNRGNAGDSNGEKIDFSKMTFGEIKKRNNLPIGHKDRIFALGRYQITPAPLREAMADRGISDSQKCTPAMQEELFLYLIFKKRPVLSAYLRGTSEDVETAMKELALEFASIPKKDGRGAHDKVGNNKAMGGTKRYEKIKGILKKTREKIVGKIEKKTEKPSGVEKALYPKKNTSPYINPRESNHRSMKRNLENTLKVSGYPDSLFIKNVNKDKRYSAQEIQKISATVRELYAKKSGKPLSENYPIIYIDNENGSLVQRVKEYPEISDKKEEFKTLSTFAITEKTIQSGKISLGALEETLKKYPNNTSEIISAYAKIRVAQEKSLGLNSISLVLDKGGNNTYMKSRGFTSPELRMKYANALIKEAEKSNVQVLLKHFPGHFGLENPHITKAGIKGSRDSEMGTFMRILAENSKRKNITVMLGHIKINVDGWKEYEKGYRETGDEEKDKAHLLVASQSKVVADRLRAINPNIKLISDDIAGMKASGNVDIARKNAQDAGITVLN